jgi:hypothetical protein
MYSANMYEFVEKVNDFTKRQFGRRVKLDVHYPLKDPDLSNRKFRRDYDNGKYILYTEIREDSGRYYGHQVYDCQDFEEQVYTAVNKVIIENRAGGYELWEHRHRP